MSVCDDVKNIFSATLNLGDRQVLLQANTILLGNIPELDSMAVINVISAIEEYFDIVVTDDEINGETFATMESLCNFVDQKIARC
jgi:acyl carrier protein